MTIRWETKSLKEVSGFQGGSQPPKSQFINEPREGYVRLLQIRDFKRDDKAVYIPIAKNNRSCTDDDIMIGRYGASVGQIHRGKSGSYNVALIKTIPNNELIDQDYFYHYLTSDLFQKPLMSVADRSAQAGFSKDDIANFQVPLPPLPEQKHIVAILDEAFAGIDTAIANTEKNLANARELFESYLNAIFTKQGDGWHEASIEEVCILKSGTTVKKELEMSSGDVAYIKVADMSLTGNEEEIRGSSRFLSGSNINEKSIFPIGTTIFPKRGGAIATNKKRLTAIPVCADLNIMGVIPTELLLPKFLYFYFLNIDMAKLSSGTSIPQINNYDIAPLRIAYPESLEVQGKLIQSLEDLYLQTSNLKNIYQQKLDSLNELKQSLLQKAFSGELTTEADKLMDEAVA